MNFSSILPIYFNFKVITLIRFEILLKYRYTKWWFIPLIWSELWSGNDHLRVKAVGICDYMWWGVSFCSISDFLLIKWGEIFIYSLRQSHVFLDIPTSCSCRWPKLWLSGPGSPSVSPAALGGVAFCSCPPCVPSVWRTWGTQRGEEKKLD